MYSERNFAIKIARIFPLPIAKAIEKEEKFNKHIKRTSHKEVPVLLERNSRQQYFFSSKTNLSRHMCMNCKKRVLWFIKSLRDKALNLCHRE